MQPPGALGPYLTIAPNTWETAHDAASSGTLGYAPVLDGLLCQDLTGVLDASLDCGRRV